MSYNGFTYTNSSGTFRRINEDYMKKMEIHDIEFNCFGPGAPIAGNYARKAEGRTWEIIRPEDIDREIENNKSYEDLKQLEGIFREKNFFILDSSDEGFQATSRVHKDYNITVEKVKNGNYSVLIEDTKDIKRGAKGIDLEFEEYQGDLKYLKEKLDNFFEREIDKSNSLDNSYGFHR